MAVPDRAITWPGLVLPKGNHLCLGYEHQRQICPRVIHPHPETGDGSCLVDVLFLFFDR